MCTCADQNKAKQAVSTILGQPANRQDKEDIPRSFLPRHPSGVDRPLIATVVAVFATAAVKLASRPPSCLGPSLLRSLGGGGGRGKSPRNNGRDTKQSRCVALGPATTVGSICRPSPLLILYVRCSVTEVPTRTQSLRHRHHQMSEDTERRAEEERRRRREGEPVGPFLLLR